MTVSNLLTADLGVPLDRRVIVSTQGYPYYFAGLSLATLITYFSPARGATRSTLEFGPSRALIWACYERPLEEFMSIPGYARPVDSAGRGAGDHHKRVPADVQIRPFTPGDVENIRAMSGRLSPISLYERFFSGTPRIPGYYLASLRRLDHWNREVLLAINHGDVVGIGEYGRSKDDRSAADLAVLVIDDWQGRGVGHLLVAALAQAAGQRGLIEFRASILVGNLSALGAVRSIWGDVPPRYSDGCLTFRLPLRLEESSPAGRHSRTWEKDGS